MALLSLVFVLVQSLIQHLQPAGDGLDEATHRQMRERQELLELARLLQELEQQDEGWAAMLFGALQQWPFWVLAGVLLLLDLWFDCRRRSCEASSSKDQSSRKTLGHETVTEQEEDTADPEEGGEDSDMTLEADEIDMSLEADDRGAEDDREGSPVAADDGDKDDAIEDNYDVKEDSDVNSCNYDVKVKEDSDVNNGNGYDSKKEGRGDGDVPGDTTTEGNEEETGNAAGIKEDLDEANEEENKDVQMDQDKDTGKEGEEGNEEPGNVAGNEEDLDEANEGENKHVQVDQDKDTVKEEGEGNEEPGNVAGNEEDLDEANKGENKDVQVDQDKDTGKEEGEGNEEKNSSASIKAGNNDVNEGEGNVDGMEECMDVKVQESKGASDQGSKDWTGQEDRNGCGNEIAHSGFTAPEEANKEVIDKGGNDRNKDEEQAEVNVEGNNNKDRKEEEQGNVAASEKGGSDGGREEIANGGIEEGEDTQDWNEQDMLLVDGIQWPLEDLERGCSVTAELLESFTRVFVDSVSNTFNPVPQEAIGVGSAFEGWSPHEWDGVYRVLVPLNPPPGHTFHLEPNSAGQMAARTFSVRVELVCTCEREQLGEKLLCFLHHSQEELRQKHQRSLLETLCTGSYLDVEKTSRWFFQLVRCSWLHVPQSYSWHLLFQPRSRSCHFQLSKGKRTLTVEMLFGVRQGDSDIFVVSQPTELQEGNSSNLVSSHPAKANIIASTAWPETYAVAEAKFFQHIARQMPCKSVHLKCLQLFTCMLSGTGFSTSTWKTVVMHVLNIVPQVHWHRKEFALRLWDIMGFLEFCLKWKRLDHFVLGNEQLPTEISLPPAMRKVEPLNLFEHLARDPAAHREAMEAFGQLHFRLWMLLSNTERSCLYRAGLAKVTANGSHVNSA